MGARAADVDPLADDERGPADVGAHRRRGRRRAVLRPKGIGDRLLFAIQQNDLLVIQAIAAILVVFVVFANLVVDLLYAVVDPRIRLARSLG